MPCRHFSLDKSFLLSSSYSTYAYPASPHHAAATAAYSAWTQAIQRMQSKIEFHDVQYLLG